MRTTRALVDTTALASNIALLRDRIRSHKRIMAIVKAAAYGHGIEAILPTLERADIEHCGVAAVSEGAELRRLGFSGRITLLTTPTTEDRTEIIGLNLEPFISDADTLDWLSATAVREGSTLRAHLYVDTGMTRNGCLPDDATALAQSIESADSVELVGLASHLARSDDSDPEPTRRQNSIFDEVRRTLADNGISPPDVHLANSGGILTFPQTHGTLVRPGIALYGYHPNSAENGNSGLRPVMSVVSKISSLRTVPARTPVSYGETWHTPTRRVIATIPIGYGDGIARSFSSRLRVDVDGRIVPVVGTICMDELMIDLGTPDEAAEHAVGDRVALFGGPETSQQNAWDLAEQIGTIPYEVTTSLSARVPRRAVD